MREKSPVSASAISFIGTTDLMTPPSYSRSSQFLIRRIWGNTRYWERRGDAWNLFFSSFRSLLSSPSLDNHLVLFFRANLSTIHSIHSIISSLLSLPPPSLPFTVLLLHCLPSMYELDRNRVIVRSFYGRTPLSRVHLSHSIARFGSRTWNFTLFACVQFSVSSVLSSLSHFYSRCPFPLWSLRFFLSLSSPLAISTHLS